VSCSSPGPVPGGEPTATAVLGDVIDASRGVLAGSAVAPRIRVETGEHGAFGELPTQWCLRLDVEDSPGVLAQIAAAFGDAGVSIKSVRQDGRGDIGDPARRHPRRPGGCAAQRRRGPLGAPGGHGGLVGDPRRRRRGVSRGVIARYRDRLPVTDATPVVTLGEGGTPLVPAPEMSAGGREVWLKVEGANPTGSFKDRGMTVAVSKALEAGATAVVCASTGNTSASAAAYAARAGIECVVVLPPGKVALGKLAQAVRHGARIVAVDGGFDAALGVVRQLATRDGVALVNSVNPYRMAGQETAAWEIVDELGRAPAVHALPVGNAGNITAYWAGYRAVGEAPQMWGFQAAGAAPLVSGEIVEDPETVATAIRIGNPASWEGAVAARDRSGGRIEAVTDASDPRRLRPARLDGGGVRRAGLGGRCRRDPRLQAPTCPTASWCAPSPATASKTLAPPSETGSCPRCRPPSRRLSTGWAGEVRAGRSA
jgi:threonine synthase